MLIIEKNNKNSSKLVLPFFYCLAIWTVSILFEKWIICIRSTMCLPHLQRPRPFEVLPTSWTGRRGTTPGCSCRSARTWLESRRKESNATRTQSAAPIMVQFWNCYITYHLFLNLFYLPNFFNDMDFIFYFFIPMFLL